MSDMNRFACLSLMVLIAAGSAYSQSLGDVARQNRAVNKKPAAHVYTNDDFAPAVPAEPAPDAAKEPAKAPPDAAPDSAKHEDSEKKPADADSSNAVEERYKAAIEEKKKAIELLQREINVAERENQVQTTVFYADAGSRLRNPKDFVEARQKREAEIATKKKQLAEAQSKLEALQDEARKAGLPSNATE